MTSPLAPLTLKPISGWRGAKGQVGWKLEAATFIGALILHAGFTLLPAEPTLELAQELDAFDYITLDEPEPKPEAEPEAEPEPAANEPKPSAGRGLSTAPKHQLDEPNANDIKPPGDLSEAKPLEGEAAAPVLVSDFADSSDNFTMVTGEGTRLSGGRAGKVGGGTGRGRGPATKVAARDLSRNPIAPMLTPYINRNYPSSARMNGVSAEATLRLVIQADGTTTDIRVRSVSRKGYGFGETCSRSLHQGPKWKPALNRNGRPITFEVTYTCTFLAPKRDVASSSGKPTVGSGANRVWAKPAGG